jgi:ubiquinone biosynthesis protein UbiJ
MLSAPLIPVLHRLLADQPAARAMLTRHAGKAFRIDLIAPIFAAQIAEDGNVLASPEGAAMATEIELTPALLLRLLAGERHAISEAQARGDGLLAADLRNAFEAVDLALALRPYLGDILAARVADGVSALHGWQAKAQESAAKSVAEYLVHETDALAGKAAVAEFMREVDRLRDDVARLEARLQLLEAGKD